MWDRGPQLNFGYLSHRIGRLGERADLFKGRFSFFDERHHGVEPLAKVDHSPVDDGSYPQVTVQVRDELHRITSVYFDAGYGDGGDRCFPPVAQQALEGNRILCPPALVHRQHTSLRRRVPSLTLRMVCSSSCSTSFRRFPANHSDGRRRIRPIHLLDCLIHDLYKAIVNLQRLRHFVAVPEELIWRTSS